MKPMSRGRGPFFNRACVMAVDIRLIVTDAPPLITLAAAKSLDYLLYPELPVLIPDAVFHATSDFAELVFTLRGIAAKFGRHGVTDLPRASTVKSGQVSPAPHPWSRSAQG
jgi:hypothetical protein